MNACAVLRSAACIAAVLMVCTPAHAQIFRAYVASDGSDANPCTLQQPCRLLPAALGAVADGGEIWMLDSANYNTATVNVGKSVSILAIPGALGSVVAIGGPAISIATAGAKVKLRNLVIVPLPGGSGTDGISMTGGISLTVQDCLLENLPGNAISAIGAFAIRLTDVTIRDNAIYGVLLQDGARATITRAVISGSLYGVAARGTLASTTTTADIADTTLDANGYGAFAWSLNATAVVKASLRESRVVRGSGIGVYAESLSGGSVTFSVTNNIISNNSAYGVASWNAGSTVVASGNTISDNGSGFVINGAGVIESAGNNVVRNNNIPLWGGSLTSISTM